MLLPNVEQSELIEVQELASLEKWPKKFKDTFDKLWQVRGIARECACGACGARERTMHSFV